MCGRISVLEINGKLEFGPCARISKMKFKWVHFKVTAGVWKRSRAER